MSTIDNGLLEPIFEHHSSTIAKDLKLNLQRLLEESQLEPEERLLALLALSIAADHSELVGFARTGLEASGVDPDKIQEAAHSAAIMGMLNTYYKFRTMIGNEEDYRSAGLRMTSLAQPLVGKKQFEMLAFAVSVFNGCESCIRSHEKVLRDHGLSAQAVHDLARMAAVVKGVASLQTASFRSEVGQF